MKEKDWVVVLIVVTLAIGLVVYGALGYAAVHFIRKYW